MLRALKMHSGVLHLSTYMSTKPDLKRLGLWMGVLLLLVGCGDGHGPESGDHEGGHAHQPKYGGKLVELGHHEGNVELVLDPSTGRLTAYLLDAHAENFVRLPLDSFVVVAQVQGAEQILTFKPVGNPATGEKAGDTSQFEATADWLKSATSVQGRIRELPVKAKVYRDVPFSLSKP